MKLALKNTTVSTTVYAGVTSYSVKRGKGTGSQLISLPSLEEAKRFDDEFNKLEYRLIKQDSTACRGGAWFYKGTTKMFDTSHPFHNDFTIIK